MRDGQTRRLGREAADQAVFLARHCATLVVLDGPSAGTEHTLGAPQCAIGRGPDVDIAFADDSMYKRHAIFELGPEGFRIRDLDSTNGLRINGSPVSSADLKHGDKIGIGLHTLQYVVEERASNRTYDLSDDL